MLCPLAGTRGAITTKAGVPVASGYQRIVLGGRGPYVEFAQDDLEWAAMVRVEAPHYYYDEWRVDDAKVYCQIHIVDYADYRVGLYYVSPFYLLLNGAPMVAARAPRQLSLL